MHTNIFRFKQYFIYFISLFSLIFFSSLFVHVYQRQKTYFIYKQKLSKEHIKKKKKLITAIDLNEHTYKRMYMHTHMLHAILKQQK